MKVAPFTLLAFALLGLSLGCNSPPQEMKNELKVVAPAATPTPVPVGGLRDPSVKPVVIKPNPVGAGGIPDDSIKPVGPQGIRPVGRGGVPDDSVRPGAPK